MEDGFEPTPQELVMTLLGSHVHPRDSRKVWSGGLVALLAELGFSDGAARIALARLAHRDLLARHKQGRLVHYTLTHRTIAMLEDGDRRIFSLGRESGPDGERGEWTVLWQSIPESHRKARERLVRRLRFLGFGSIQDGTWLAPRDRDSEVVALLEELRVAEYASLMLGRPSALLDVRAFAGRAWDLDGLDQRYETFVTEFAGYGTAAGRLELDDRSSFRIRTRLVHTFRQFPSIDPELPSELISAPPKRADAVALFHDLYAALAPAAQRHFDEVTRP
jgi:phenylacetic acid degradation operon negative regulatory protein